MQLKGCTIVRKNRIWRIIEVKINEKGENGLGRKRVRLELALREGLGPLSGYADGLHARILFVYLRSGPCQGSSSHSEARACLHTRVLDRDKEIFPLIHGLLFPHESV